MFSPREVIEDIRKNKYGIGLKTDSQTEKVIEGLKSTLNNALEQLSEDLYSKENHFILELIQNADDNDYENGVAPLLKFTIDHEKIFIQNNEKGFTEANVRALCDVGKTTKLKRLGYLGEKGIGFKSVFRISNTPQIFSNGFRFEFKRKDTQDKLGFVVPYWIDEIPEFVDEKLTNIVLPLRKEVRDELSKFDEIEPTLILCLRKLKIIEIYNITENEHNKVVLEEKDGRAEITCLKGKKYYKLVRKTLAVPKDIQEQEEKRKDVKETELILAFPLKEDGSADANEEQKVFAYLPTREYGFKFIIQSDFLVPASREDIHKDKLWNNFLRDNIASVFLKAVGQFKQDENLKTTYYNFIPLANEVTDEFFSPVVRQIYINMRENECILTESGNWLKPIRVLRADKDIRDLIPNEDLNKLFNKEYISHDIKTNKLILDALEVPEFEFDHLVQCLQEAEWLKQQGDEWFIRLYSYLNSLKLKEKQIKELKNLKILRLENNELASTIEKPVFSPLDKKGDYGFEKELRIIKRTIFEPKEKKIKEAVGDFLKKIGVQDALPYEIIEGHILPIYKSNDSSSNWKSKDEKLLLGYIRYIKDNLQNYEKESDKQLNANKKSWEAKDPLARLKSSLYIRINKNVKGTHYYDLPENIYLSKIYGNENNLEVLFKGIDSISFVHRAYIDDIIKKYRHTKRKGKNSNVDIQKRREAEIKEWKEFFIKLGVNDGLKVEETNESYLTWEDKERLRGGWNYTSEKIIDYKLIPLQQILERVDEKKAKHLISLFETHWEWLANYKQLQYQWFYYSWQPWKYADSTWIHLLKTTAWLPTSKENFAKPSEVFLDKPEVRELLGDSVPYLTVDIKNEKLIKDLGINSEANVEEVLNYLKSLTQKCEDKTVFTKLYEFLDKNYENNEDIINKTFTSNRIIYLPGTAQRYFTSHEVLWKDVSDIFGKNRGYLEKYYPKLKSFFVDKLGVSEKPKPKDYADVLVDLSQKKNIDKEDLELILEIYKKFNNHLNPENNEHLISEEDWWNDFISKPIFWTDKEEFWKNDNDVFVDDNQELYKLFKDNPKIAFLKLPKNYHPKIQYFIEAVRISYLSKAVTIELATGETPEIEQLLTDDIQRFIPYILRYLYQLEYTAYERLKKDGTIAQLKNLTCYSIESLKVKYKLYSELVFDKRSSLLYNGKLYIQKDQRGNIDYLAVELSKLFGKIRGLDDFLISLFSKKTVDEIENLLRAKGIQELPEEEEKWFGAVEKNVKVIEKKKEKETPFGGKPPVSVHTNKSSHIVQSDIPDGIESITEKKLSEKTEWQPELPPEDVPPHIEKAQSIEKTEPSSPKEKKQISTPLETPKEIDRDVLSQKAKMAIGRWGEEYALKCLKKNLRDKYPKGKVEETEDGFTISLNERMIVKVQWLNKINDRGEGYDIKVIDNNVEEYIEVKSTKTDTKDWFEVSGKQWKLMERIKDKFHIYRVYNAGTKEAKLIDIPNPYKMWQEGGLTAYPIRIQI